MHRLRGTRLVRLSALAVVPLCLAACASIPAPSVPRANLPATLPTVVPSTRPLQPASPAPSGVFSLGSEIVVRAIALLGTPYEFGGDAPGGFDCSGLVRYVHHELGIEVPRTAAEQYRAALAVDLEHLEPGDLLFFRTQGAGVSHVA